jgi:N-acetyl-gamma-glutamyl-phosphate reductase
VSGRAPGAKIRVAIVGGTGYGGMELLRYLLDHPNVEITAITSRTETGKIGDVHPHLRGLTDLSFTGERARDLASSNDLLFFATPHGVAAKEVPDVLADDANVRVIDLSADFRLVAVDERFRPIKGREAPDEAWSRVAYGLPECGGRSRVIDPACRVVANPGCHASAAILGLYPLARPLSEDPGPWHGLELASIVSVTGSSGSGATPAQGTHHPERFANFRAYKPLRHQHEAEIASALWQLADAQDPHIAFVPCSGPFARGIGSTVLIDVGDGLRRKGLDAMDDDACIAELRRLYSAVYDKEPFVRLVPDTAEVRAVAGTNFADIGVTVRLGVVCVTVAIDNLGKGMAGTAVQNMNLLFGLPETTGLLRAGAGL